MEEQRGKQWHLDKTFSIGHLLTTTIMASSVVLWAMKMDTRISVIEAKQAASKENQQRIELQVRESLEHIDAALIRIETKLDHKKDK